MKLKTKVPTFSDLVNAETEYGIWALNTVHNVYSVSYSLPIRLTSSKCTSLEYLIADISELEKLQSNNVGVDFGDPLSILEHLPFTISENRLKKIANDLSQRVFISGGAYANPIFTHFRKFPEWRIAEIIATFSAATRRNLVVCKNGSFTFSGPLRDYFFFARRQLRSIGAQLQVGPCWRWKRPENFNEIVGPEQTRTGVNLILNALKRRSEPEQSKRLTDRYFDNSRLFRLGHVRAAVMPEDVQKRLVRISEAFELALCVQLNEISEKCSYEETVEFLIKTNIGVNHWNGLAVLSLALSSSKYRNLNLKQFFYKPPSLKQPKLNDEDYLMLCAEQNNGWAINFKSLGRLKNYNRDRSGRLFFKNTQNESQLFESLGRYLSRQVDKNHTNRHHFLDERINLLRYQLSDSSSNLLMRDQSDHNSSSGQDRIPGLSGISFNVPQYFASNIAYTLGADVCNIYIFDFNERRLGKVQSHAGPYALERDTDETRLLQKAETDYVWISGAASQTKEKCLVYDAVKTSIEARSSINASADIGLRFSHKDLTSYEWPQNIPKKYIGKDAVVVPIKVFGRSWGVIELRGRYPKQLRQSTLTWLDEIARMVGERLFQEWVNQHIQLLVEFASYALKSPDRSDANIHNAVTSTLISLFMCEACFIWYRDKNDADIISFEAAKVMSSGEDISREMRLKTKLRSINTEDLEGISDTLIEEFLTSELQFAQYDLQEADTYWTGGEVCQKLNNLNLSNCCLIRLENDYGNVEGVIWLAGHMPFEPTWEGILPSISAQIKLVLDIAHGRQFILSQHQKSLAHEARSSIDVIDRSIDDLAFHLKALTSADLSGARRTLAALRLMISKNGGFSSLNSPDSFLHFRNFENLCSPIKPNFNDQEFNQEVIRDYIRRIDSAVDRGRMNIDNLMHGEVSNLKFKADSKIDFRDILEERINLNSSYVHYDRTKAPIWLGQRTSIDIRFPYESADFIISNLISNAVKYNIGIRGPEILHKQTISKEFEEHSFVFKNVGWKILRSEKKKIREWKRRGKFAANFWAGDGIGAGLSGIEHHMSSVNCSNPRISVRLEGPRQSIIRKFDFNKVNRNHPSVIAWKQQPSARQDYENYALIEFVLHIKNYH